MKPGAIVLTVIPQDGAISSQLHQHIPGFDVILESKHPAFLPVASKRPAYPD